MKIQLESDKILNAMAETFKERNAEYGSNYNAVGEIMVSLFPKGILLKTSEDFVKFHFIDWIVGKLTRFGRTDMKHIDSLHDMAVYAAMLEDLIIQLEKEENI